MTLAQRLLLAIAVLTVAATAAFGFGVREAWRRTEEKRFSEQFTLATEQLTRDLKDAIDHLPTLVGPLCQHDPMVDSALVDLRAGRLDASRRLSLSLRVPELMKGLRLDELVLVAGSGVVLGSHEPGEVGRRAPELVAKLRQPADRARLRTEPRPLALETHCQREDHGYSVGLYAARHLQPVLDEAASSHGIEIGLTPPPKEQDRMLKVFRIPELGGLSLAATRSRVPLVEALRRLDVTLLVMAAGTLAAALVFAGLLSRGLARPIVELSEQAGRAVHGDPVPVRGRGGRELRHLADAFNRAISDLASLRRRLALTERIAARREIARRVAHEIKNPLAPIRTAVETLRRLRARNDPAFEDYFDEATRTVLDEVVRINTIVTEFTRFARLPPPQPVRHDLVESVRKVVGLHARDDIQIRVDAPTVLDVLADRDQMVQVLTNLLQNAIDACASAPDPHIAVTLEKDGDGARLSVRDNGPGLSEEVRSRLFEPYVTTKPHGTGLGLAIVERIVVEHDGEIRYADAAEGGAEFIIHLPGSGPISSAPRPTA